SSVQVFLDFTETHFCPAFISGHQAGGILRRGPVLFVCQHHRGQGGYRGHGIILVAHAPAFRNNSAARARRLSGTASEDSPASGCASPLALTVVSTGAAAAARSGRPSFARSADSSSR